MGESVGEDCVSVECVGVGVECVGVEYVSFGMCSALGFGFLAH